jgi:hypothetical protein
MAGTGTRWAGVDNMQLRIDNRAGDLNYERGRTGTIVGFRRPAK